jgi:hypothetical protein
MQINIGIAAVLLVFYLYLLVRKDGIARPLFYWIGLGGLALAAIAGSLAVMGTGRAIGILSALFGLIGFLVALAGAVASCYKGSLPFGMGDEASQAEAPSEGGGNIDLSGGDT